MERSDGWGCEGGTNSFAILVHVRSKKLEIPATDFDMATGGVWPAGIWRNLSQVPHPGFRGKPPVFFEPSCSTEIEAVEVEKGSPRSISIATEVGMVESGLEVSRKAVLVVLFVPSVQRDIITAINQEYWVDAALGEFGELFGGATAFPPHKGVSRDDELGGVLIKDEPVVIHCYTTPAEISDPDRLNRLGSFCRRMGREAHQGEVGLVVGDEYLAFRDFSQE